MRAYLLLIIYTSLFLGLNIVNAQTFEWAIAFGGNTFDYNNDIITDYSGNVYTVGVFQNTVDFDPGVNATSFTSKGNHDGYIQKISANGNHIWTVPIGGIGVDNVRSIALDNVGNIYTTGSFEDTVDFDPSSTVNNLISSGNQDVFIQKLDSNGNLVWAKSFGGDTLDIGFSIAVDGVGNIYVTGSFQDSVDFDPGINSNILSSQGYFDIFVQKLDANGNFIWAKSFGGKTTDHGIDIAIDNLDNVYIVGEFRDTVDFDPSSTVNNLISSGGQDAFIQKLDANGNFIWAKSFGGSSYDTGKSIAFDNKGNLYSTGLFSGTVNFNVGTNNSSAISNGRTDTYIQKLDVLGNIIWVKVFGGTWHDYGCSITTDTLGNVYTAGAFNDTVDFNSGVGVNQIISSGSFDGFVHIMDSSGNFIGVNTFGNYSFDRADAVVIDVFGNIYTSGIYERTVDFDPSNGITNLTSVGRSDIFVRKMSQTITSTPIYESNNNVQLITYPNPTKGVTHIKFEQPASNVELTLTDILGKTILERNYKSLSNTSIDIANSSGIYFLNIKAKESQHVIKIVKE